MIFFKQRSRKELQKTPLQGQLKAFTLTEIMVVLVIVGILTLIALPNLTGLFTKAYEIEAQTQLKAIHTFQQSYRQVNFKYTNDFVAISFQPPKTIKEDGEAKYEYQIISSSESGFLARATAVADFDGDGTMNVWEIDQSGKPRRIIPD